MALTRQRPSPSATMLLPSSSWSNSSEISPTICSSTSSMVMRPEMLPNSSMTRARWLRVSLKSRNSTLIGCVSGMKRAGRRSVFGSTAGFISTCSRSLACRMPSTLSRSSSTAGRRECPEAMRAGSQTSRGSEKSTACTWERGTIRSPALISETAIAPSIMENTSSSITLRRRASPSTSSTSARSLSSSSWKTEVRRSRKVRPKVGLGGSEELDIFAGTACFQLGQSQSCTMPMRSL